MTKYDTIVVGLGSSGTTAATTLARAGRRVLALEAQDRIGGRVCTVPFGDGVVELGAEWIHGQQPSRVYDLAISNKVEVIPQDMTIEMFRSDGSVADQALFNELILVGMSAAENPPPKPEPLGQYITKNLTGYIKDKYPQLVEDEDFMRGLLDFMNLLVDNYEASDDWNDVSAYTRYEELDGHQHVSWHVNGYRTFFDILLNKYNNGPGLSSLEIKLSTEVTRIEWPQDANGVVKVTTKGGTTYTADNVIVTVSIGVLKERYETLFASPLPEDKVTAIKSISIGVMDKVILLFPHIWWPQNVTWFGFLWRDSDRKEIPAADYWVTRIFGASTPMGSKRALTLWTSGRVAQQVETLPEDVIKTKCLELLRRFMGANTTIPEPTKIIRSTWYTNPYTRGSYTYDNHLVTVYPDARASLARPLTDSAGKPRVLFAGEATDQTHFSTVHGAADTGYREASRLLPQKFYIIQSGTCELYLNSRRNTRQNQTIQKFDISTQARLNYSDSENKTHLREDNTLTTLYEIDSAFDYHVCPLSCPDVYSPVCVSVNRGFGKYFKFYTFANHCSGDLYYCKHWREFSPPPDEDEMVNSSPLGWSYCGASRYLQFARFSEVLSAMGHYGWLAGDYRYSHIMAPHERVPGYG